MGVSLLPRLFSCSQSSSQFTVYPSLAYFCLHLVLINIILASFIPFALYVCECVSVWVVGYVWVFLIFCFFFLFFDFVLTSIFQLSQLLLAVGGRLANMHVRIIERKPRNDRQICRKQWFIIILKKIIKKNKYTYFQNCTLSKLT